jgi:hypothetical protein
MKTGERMVTRSSFTLPPVDFAINGNGLNGGTRADNGTWHKLGDFASPSDALATPGEQSHGFAGTHLAGRLVHKSAITHTARKPYAAAIHDEFATYGLTK